MEGKKWRTNEKGVICDVKGFKRKIFLCPVHIRTLNASNNNNQTNKRKIHTEGVGTDLFEGT